MVRPTRFLLEIIPPSVDEYPLVRKLLASLARTVRHDHIFEAHAFEQSVDSDLTTHITPIEDK